MTTGLSGWIEWGFLLLLSLFVLGSIIYITLKLYRGYNIFKQQKE